MPPKKKNNKKADDWESELGESAEPVAAADPVQEEPEEEVASGGLMATMKKKAKSKKSKGKPAEDFVDGEDPPTAEPEPDLATKAPEEATMEEEFALPEKKGKGKAAPPAKEAKVEEDEDEERGTDGKILSKKEKEKLKKEREKQRKKEQVHRLSHSGIIIFNPLTLHRLQQRRRQHHKLPKLSSLQSPLPQLNLKPRSPKLLILHRHQAVKERNLLHI